MSNPFTRGSAPGRARDASQRPGSFKPGHKKVGGRKKRHAEPHVGRLQAGCYGRGGSHWNGWDGRGRPCRIYVLPRPTAPRRLLQTFVQNYRYRTSLSRALIPGRGSTRCRPPPIYSTDGQQSEDALIAEMTIMAIKDPEAFSTAIAALLPRPSKRQLQMREY